ncbi:hypothetical protein SDRG_06319 [Saprolegnia diclina VS20]|uniref:Uncharacterized protein n=1 Tax=Saprolegnia diclina (strain VS20) TaxID=1156394 RepID=T0QE80_SAPDV|nr:hypothetical protein SDRG_06319 [Saprolegnia diclina VS20]EQC36209.1 hypothetical protein SDRG_06319 [Saprolegnia diclina VS20]|eukprot:XP_008610315.1 hypothetical protein SDRG_06319 [Saprolegnia diclina VS20]
MARGGNNKRIIGLLVGAGGLLSFSMPFLIVQSKKDQNTMSMEGPLSTSQIRRGVYMNTGSKDIGRDPDWDLTTNSYKGRRTAYPPRDEASTTDA